MYEITLIENCKVVKNYTANNIPIEDDRILLENSRAFKVEKRVLSAINPNSVVLLGITFGSDILGKLK